MRNSEVRRETAETSVVLSLELDGSGRAEIRRASASWTTC